MICSVLSLISKVVKETKIQVFFSLFSKLCSFWWLQRQASVYGCIGILKIHPLSSFPSKFSSTFFKVRYGNNFIIKPLGTVQTYKEGRHPTALPSNTTCEPHQAAWCVSVSILAVLNSSLIGLKTHSTRGRPCPVLETYLATQCLWSHGCWRMDNR